MNSFSKLATTEIPSTTNKAITQGACEDISSKCDLYAKYCGTNSYVTGRCQKTCGQCGKPIYRWIYLFENSKLSMVFIYIIFIYLLNVNTTTLGVCADISTKCDMFEKYCGKNNYVTKRCLKTCRICSKLMMYYFWNNIKVSDLKFASLLQCFSK